MSLVLTFFLVAKKIEIYIYFFYCMSLVLHFFFLVAKKKEEILMFWEYIFKTRCSKIYASDDTI